jgi:hypothetical protein
MPESQDAIFFGVMGGSLAIMFASVIYLPLQYSYVGLVLGVSFMIFGLFGSESIAKFAASGWNAHKGKTFTAGGGRTQNFFLHKGEPLSYPVGWWDPKTQKVVPHSKDADGKDLEAIEFETQLYCKTRRHPRYGKYNTYFLRTIGTYSGCFPQQGFTEDRVVFGGVGCDHKNVATVIYAEYDVPKDIGYNVYAPVYACLWSPSEYIRWEEEYKAEREKKMISRLQLMRRTVLKEKASLPVPQDDAKEPIPVPAQ